MFWDGEIGVVGFINEKSNVGEIFIGVQNYYFMEASLELFSALTVSSHLYHQYWFSGIPRLTGLPGRIYLSTIVAMSVCYHDHIMANI